MCGYRHCRPKSSYAVFAFLINICVASPWNENGANAQSLGDASVNYRWRAAPTPYAPRTDRLPPVTGEQAYGVIPSPTPMETPINASYMGRAAVFADDTRLADFAEGKFLPSAIPVAGQPFFGTGWRANLQGAGSAVRVDGYAIPRSDVVIEGHAQLLVQNATFPGTGSSDGGNIAIREAFGRINRLSVGVMDTAFGDPSAEPETLDLAGPNARVTINPGGLGEGLGRLSYDLLSDEPDGFETILSLEQPQPQIETSATTGTFARYPDFVTAFQYVEGDWVGKNFYERWHLQFASVLRGLGLEDATAAQQHVFGWGTTFSGAYRYRLNPCLKALDRAMFSVTYGEGISHYITDLNAAPDTNDAVLNGGGVLVPLPVLAWYVGYTHNWTDNLRTTATYSQVNLDSVLPLGATSSPYRTGEYIAVNLVFHRPFATLEGEEEVPHNFYTGLECLFGRKEVLDGAEGEAQRIMWVTSISK